MKSLLGILLNSSLSFILTVVISMSLFYLHSPRVEAVHIQEPKILPFYVSHNTLAMERLSRDIYTQLDLLEEAQYNHLIKLRELNQEIKIIRDLSK